MGKHAADTAVWKALADPTRREILDLLRIEPRTTGEIASRFAVTRFAVMKHLKALTEAGLVLVTRRGRERWNRLNPVPIREIHRRWIRPFEATPADALLRLRNVATTPSSGARPVSEKPAHPAFDVVTTVLAVTIEAPPRRVWDAIVSETSAWGPRDFYNHAEPRAFVIEPVVGGRMYEDWGNGDGMQWATVIGLKKGERLQLSGELSADFGGPARSTQTFVLAPDGDGTRVELTDVLFGRVSDGTAGCLEQGWRSLLEGALKPWIEEERHPERPATVA